MLKLEEEKKHELLLVVSQLHPAVEDTLFDRQGMNFIRSGGCALVT